MSGWIMETTKAANSCPVARERERIEHLVLGRPRPPARKIGRGKSARKVPHELDPEIERAVALRETYGGRQGTPETFAHLVASLTPEELRTGRTGAIARLHHSGAIDEVQLGSAVAIAAIAERIMRDATIGTASLETRVDVSRVGERAAFETLAQVRAERAYGRWRDAMGVFACPIIEIIAQDRGVTIVAQRYRLHVRRLRRLLIDALDLWPGMLAEARRDIDQADVDRAHARIN